MSISFSGLKIFDSYFLKQYVKQNKIDLIHCHTSNAHTLAYYSGLFGMHRPIIVSKRTDFPIRSAKKYNHKDIAAVLCVSDKINEITTNSIVDKNKVHTVYSGIDPSRFNVIQKSLKEMLGISKESVLIGNCSAIADQKDYFTFLDVAKKLPHYEFVIIGSGPLEKEVMNYASTLNLKNIHFTGFMNDIESYLSSLDLFLITSKTEGLGTSILDAMICKIPVVATKAGGIPEIVIDRKTGLLEEIGNSQRLSQNVENLISNSQLREKLCQEAFKNVSVNFTKEATADATYQIYLSSTRL